MPLFDVNFIVPANPITGLGCGGGAITTAPGFNSSAVYALPQAPELVDALGVNSNWYDASSIPKTKTLAEMRSLGVGAQVFFSTSKGGAVYSTAQIEPTLTKIKKAMRIV